MFPSFFLAGFECTTGLNRHGDWIDQIAATQHDQQVDSDYSRLIDQGISGVREGLRWPLIDREGTLDFRSAEPFVHAANRHGMTVIWDLFHYGYPEDLDPFSPTFVERFTRYCAAAARWIGEQTSGPWYFTPVNEPSYLAWAGGDQALFAPHARGRGPELKRALVTAAIRGIDAIHSVLPSARIVNADPWCRMVAPLDRPDLIAGCASFNDHAVFESWDMLCGRLHPELGGSRSHLDIIGINYYSANQWEWGKAGIALGMDDSRRWQLSAAMTQIHARYGGPLMISETSHAGATRAEWMREVAKDCDRALAAGISLQGLCIYPILGMPDWHDPSAWTQMGLWECQLQEGVLHRRLFAPMHEALRDLVRDTQRVQATG